MTRRLYSFLVLSFVASACTSLFFDEDPPNTHVATFDHFWSGIDEIWPEFSTKQVNWDSMYTVYRPLVDLTKNDKDLILIFHAMIKHLRDGHTGLYIKQQVGLPYYGYQKDSVPANFFGYQWLRANYLQDAVFNSVVTYDKLSPDVGYVYISSFGASQDQYEIIDQIIKEFKGMKGIIIDVRGNGGGSSINADIIASRFITQRTTCFYNRYRTGRERMAMSDYVPIELDPDGPEKFMGKVVVLTNGQVFSAAEGFVLAMRASGHVTVMGDNTKGGSGTRPVLKELPNGWVYRVSSTLLCDLAKQPINDGIAPDILVSTTEADHIARKDTIIEAAITEILK